MEFFYQPSGVSVAEKFVPSGVQQVGMITLTLAVGDPDSKGKRPIAHYMVHPEHVRDGGQAFVHDLTRQLGYSGGGVGEEMVGKTVIPQLRAALGSQQSS